MEDNLLLDYAIFIISSAQNRYDSIICCKGKTEKFVSGTLGPLSLFLQDAKEFKSSSSDGSCKLQFQENIRDSSWYNKSTLARFLHTVNSPDMVKSAEAILNEMSQLEETRKFHLSLYSKANAGAVTSETTKNELIRALDLRLTALNEETAIAFTRSLGSNLSSNEISHLTSFLLHFCAPDLRNVLSNNLKTLKPSEPNHQIQNNIQQTQVSSAKLAQTERQISSDSEESNHHHHKNKNSSDSDSEIQAERTSRPSIRAPSPRRSASPMRRVQIGRSGSRRAQAISIKSLSYFPARDRAGFDRDMEEAEGERKTEVNVTRLSVKDAISMFECKKGDEGGERKTGLGLGFGGGVNVNKGVLRRWSSSNAESRNKSENDNGNNNDVNLNGNVSSDLVSEGGEKKGEESVEKRESEMEERETEAPLSISNGEEKNEQNENADKAVTSAEWNRQKEAELNEMLLKIMGANAKPGKYGLIVKKSTEQKGDISTENKDLREEKTLKTVKTRKPVQDKKPTVVNKKGSGTKEKKISPIPPNRAPRRNSAPQIAPKKEVLKPNITPPVSKRASPRSSPVPSSSLTKSTNNSLKTKNSMNLNTSTNSNTPISRRKPQNTPPSSQPSPKRTERAVVKPKKEIGGEIKPVLKGQSENKPKIVARASNNVNDKGTKLKNSPSSLGEDVKPKPSFYNKVTKKSSVVPLESKPTLKKSSISAKNKLNSNISASPKSSTKSLVQSQDKELVPVIKNSVPELNKSQPENQEPINLNPELPPKNELPYSPEQETPETESHFQNPGTQILISTTEVLQPEEENEISIISSDAWVEEDQEQTEAPVESENGENKTNEIEASSEIEMEISSPKIRHSLSQMLQAEIQEPEMVEWGNAENPPAFVFQKDSPKGFKRLLKFARKSNNNGYSFNNKGEAGSVNSEEEEIEVNMRNLGGLSAKGTVMSGESFDGKRSNSGLSAQSSGSNFNLRDGHVSSTKASRSFFSLSNFRSNKSNETKPR